jgi:hypothetical protein
MHSKGCPCPSGKNPKSPPGKFPKAGLDRAAGKHELPEGVSLPEKDVPILLAAIEARATHLLTGDLRAQTVVKDIIINRLQCTAICRLSLDSTGRMPYTRFYEWRQPWH